MATVGASTAASQVEQAVCVHHCSGRDTKQACVLSWESLDADLLELIADRVLSSDLLHYVWFRAVCKKWRAATPCPLGRGVVDPRFHPRQWMMFPEGNGLHPGHTALGGYIRFLNIYTGIFIRVHLPCFEDHSVLDCPDGLLLLQRKKGAAICLRHPFTGDVSKFPPLASFCLYMGKFGIFLNGSYDLRLRMVHAAVSVYVGGSITIMVALSHAKRVAYVSTGDKHWTHTNWMMTGMRTALPFRGSLYMVRSSKNKPSHIMRINPPDSSSSSSWPSTPPQMIATCPANQMTKPYLVECNSELLLVGYTDGNFRLVVIRLARSPCYAIDKHQRPSPLHWLLEHGRQLQQLTICSGEFRHCSQPTYQWPTAANMIWAEVPGHHCVMETSTVNPYQGHTVLSTTLSVVASVFTGSVDTFGPAIMILNLVGMGSLQYIEEFAQYAVIS